MLDALAPSKTDPARLDEILRCLQMGSVHADWLMSKEEIDRHILHAKKTSEKNYWICMKKLSLHKTSSVF